MAKACQVIAVCEAHKDGSDNQPSHAGEEKIVQVAVAMLGIVSGHIDLQSRLIHLHYKRAYEGATTPNSSLLSDASDVSWLARCA